MGGDGNGEVANISKTGLLFVHGIGEPARFEHLAIAVREFAELMKANDPTARVTIVNRTKDWVIPAGAPSSFSESPVTLTVDSEKRRAIFECHEVWWSDLGKKQGLIETLRFWVWGLGQWGALFYREKLAGWSADDGALVRLPESIAGHWRREPLARLQLLPAALATLFTFASWSLAKRVLGELLGEAASPTLLVQYIDDVRTYEGRAAPGQAALSDPGMPLRVAIRRRMVTEMVAMAQRDVERWHVVAHSLGTVLAYNGLTEIGQALPNYLPQAQWTFASLAFNRPGGTKRLPPADIAKMMPARPAWLNDADVIDRQLLFVKLRGFLTYGCPLGKFAALWPRVVATANDRVGCGESSFPPDCRWMNLAAPHDPVAGMLDAFTAIELARVLPSLTSISTPLRGWAGIAHVRYFCGFERTQRMLDANALKIDVMKWLLGGEWADPASIQPGLWVRLWVSFLYLLALAILWIATAAFVATAGGIGFSLLFSAERKSFGSLADFYHSCASAALPILSIGVTAIALCGLWRWWRESDLNYVLAKADMQPVSAGSSEHIERLRSVAAMLKWQRRVSAGILLFFVAFLMVWAFIKEFAPQYALALPFGGFLDRIGLPLPLVVSFFCIIISIAAQTAVNQFFPTLPPKPRAE